MDSESYSEASESSVLPRYFDDPYTNSSEESVGYKPVIYGNDSDANYYGGESSESVQLSYGKPIEYTYKYDPTRYSSGDDFDFEALGFTKDADSPVYNYLDYEVDTNYDYKVYDTYEYYTPVDSFNSMYTKDYLADKMGYEEPEAPAPAPAPKPEPTPVQKVLDAHADLAYPADFFDLQIDDNGNFMPLKDLDGDGFDDDMFMKDTNDNRLMDHLEDTVKNGEKLIKGGGIEYYLSDYPFIGIDFQDDMST